MILHRHSQTAVNFVAAITVRVNNDDNDDFAVQLLVDLIALNKMKLDQSMPHKRKCLVPTWFI